MSHAQAEGAALQKGPQPSLVLCLQVVPLGIVYSETRTRILNTEKRNSPSLAWTRISRHTLAHRRSRAVGRREAHGSWRERTS